MGGTESLCFSLGGVRKVRGKPKFLGAVGMNPDENHPKPVLTSVLRWMGCSQSPVTQETKLLLLDHHRDPSGALQTDGAQKISKWRNPSEEGWAALGSAQGIVELWNHYGWRSPLRALSPTITTIPPQENETCTYFISLSLTTATKGSKRRGATDCGICLLLPPRSALEHFLLP